MAMKPFVAYETPKRPLPKGGVRGKNPLFFDKELNDRIRKATTPVKGTSKKNGK